MHVQVLSVRNVFVFLYFVLFHVFFFSIWTAVGILWQTQTVKTVAYV